MLTVAKLTLGQEAYYEQQVAAGVDDYYAGRGESPGLWAGRGADGLGLAGVVADGDLGTLLRGADPASGERLRAPVRERTITVRTLDTGSGEWREQPKRLAPVSGYDLVFSCPKSVSLLHALTESEGVRRQVSEAHEAAWQAALAYLEREACVVRRGRGGAVREHGQGFVAAAFRHRTSRAQDPHLHTHVIVANMTRASDGEWRTLDGQALLQTYRLAAGYLYEAQLRHELSRRLGVGWREPMKGMGDLEGVPEEALRAFSTRRQSLLEHMQAHGTGGFAAARVAALATREQKEQVDLPRLREHWQARAAEHGLGRGELRDVVGSPDLPGSLDLAGLADRLLGPDGLTEKQTTFTMPELVCAVAGNVQDGAAVDAVLEAADELAGFPGVELLEAERAPGRPARLTTRELLEVEREALELAIAGRAADAPQLTTHVDPALLDEQQALVRAACTRPDRIVCVLGVAGSGKTTALRALGELCREDGVPVLGAAPSGRAADELAAATGITTSTLHRLLLDASRHGGLPERCLLVVDEAGMAETRALAPLLRLVEEAGGKAILVGDPAQLPAVGAGGLFAALCEQLDPVTLTENRRQLDPTERAALARLRDGDPKPYLSHAARSGRLHTGDDPTVAKQHLLEDWWQAAEPNLAGTMMLAHRRADVRELNDGARALMLAAGLLGAEALTLGEREFRLGDRVLCRRNDQRLGVRNGNHGTVVELDTARGALTVRTGGRQLQLPREYASEHLDHAYALTVHAAQGATVERAFVLLRDEGALREWAYVGCSRARSETRLYLADGEREPDAHPRNLIAGDRSEGLAWRLSASSPQRLALQHARYEDVDHARARAEQRLGKAETELERLGWLGRRRHGAQLRTEIGFQRAAIAVARKQLAERPVEPTAPRHAPTHRTRLEPAHHALCDERQHELGIEL
ncbi:MAG: relaxase domain-containing protein [Actinobacteria bacterium]|nr:relaxase domain-containing protein [Actinomycetota bacterium]